MHNVLSLIVEAAKKRVAVLTKNRAAILALIDKAPALISFKNALSRPGKMSIIGEVKQASPASGILRKDFSHLAIAATYARYGINAISVLTEEEFFLGKIQYIEEIKKETPLPVLRKDFILDEIQILESRAAGADAVLLIAGILSHEKLTKLYGSAKELGMDALIEVHTEKELTRAITLGADIIGINNRNLNTLQVDLTTTQKLIPFIPSDTIKVSESGIQSLKDVLWLKGLGIQAILVGSAFMKSENIEEKVKELHIDRD
ncbi:MAG: indole-3-glycerol phosphate synthase TrpC [Candidatus Omnitrophota bacterium]|nr:indole-3-glycerol phosphate synthase TrpC [Candidatus Omnitrophota bacterium]